MSNSVEEADEQNRPPRLARDEDGDLRVGDLASVIQWFLDYDPRVAVIKHPRVEEVFRWKQEESQRANESVYLFNRAEDRLAVGIMQALAEYDTEAELHDWIGQLLGALDEAKRSNEQAAEAYKLNTAEFSAVDEAAKIPTRQGRTDFLVSCWIETLCTAEVRILGWVYHELYGRPFHPNNF
ncbi:MAG TPA: hypothetical protein VF507_05860 [Pyrinomonadaceae bacterium]